MITTDIYETIPTRVKEQIDREFEMFKKMYPHLTDEENRALAMGAAGAKGYLSMVHYPERHTTPNTP